MGERERQIGRVDVRRASEVIALFRLLLLMIGLLLLVRAGFVKGMKCRLRLAQDFAVVALPKAEKEERQDGRERPKLSPAGTFTSGSHRKS